MLQLPLLSGVQRYSFSPDLFSLTVTKFCFASRNQKKPEHFETVFLPALQICTDGNVNSLISWNQQKQSISELTVRKAIKNRVWSDFWRGGKCFCHLQKYREERNLKSSPFTHNLYNSLPVYIRCLPERERLFSQWEAKPWVAVTE